MYIYIGNILTESEIQILNDVLAKHLTKLKENGLDLNQDYHITKEEVVIQLQKLDDELANILSKKNGNISSIKIVDIVEGYQTKNK